MSLARLRWIVLTLLCLSTAINYIDRQTLSVLLPTLRKELLLTSESYGRITTLFLVAYTIFQLLSGILLDKIGTRRGFSISILIWSLAGMLHAFVRGFGSLAVVRFILGIGEAGNWPAGGKVVSVWFPPERRAFAMGLFDGGSALGAILAPPLAAVMTIHFGWRSTFFATGLLGLIWLAFWLWLYEVPQRHRWLSEEDRRQAAAQTQEITSVPAGTRPTWVDLLQTRALWGLMATRMTATPVWWFYVFWLPDYLDKGRHFTLAEIGLFGWIPYVAVDLGKLIGGSCSDRLIARGYSLTVARKCTMLAGAVAMAAGGLVVDAATSTEAISWVCCATFGFGIWSANILALHADIFPPAEMGSALGLTGMAASLGGALASYETGRFVDAAGYRPIFVTASLAALVACVSLFIWVGPIKSRIKLGEVPA